MQATGYKDGAPSGLVLEKYTFSQADADAYQGSIDYLLLENGTQLTPAPLPEAPPEPTPDPLAEGVALYKAANEAAKEIIFILMTQVAGMLVAFGIFTRENVNDEGADFVAFHESPITNFERAGRNAKSAQALYNAIASPESRAAFPWLEANDEYILNIFASELLTSPA